MIVSAVLAGRSGSRLEQTCKIVEEEAHWEPAKEGGKPELLALVPEDQVLRKVWRR